MKNRHNNNINWMRLGAFTLIELMAVIAIMVIMMTVAFLAVPRLVKARGVMVGGVNLVATMEHARQLAVARRTSTRVSFIQKASSIFLNETNTCRVWYKDALINNDLYPDAWVWAPGYDQPKAIAPNTLVIVQGRESAMQYYSSRSDIYNYTVGSTNYAVSTGPGIRWQLRKQGQSMLVPYIEFDATGRPTFNATVTVVQSSSRTLGRAETNLNNYVRIILTAGASNIKVERP